MKICVVGAGSIGGLLGVKLALAGHDVTLIARGANLAFLVDLEALGTHKPVIIADFAGRITAAQHVILARAVKHHPFALPAASGGVDLDLVFWLFDGSAIGIEVYPHFAAFEYAEHLNLTLRHARDRNTVAIQQTIVGNRR